MVRGCFVWGEQTWGVGGHGDCCSGEWHLELFVLYKQARVVGLNHNMLHMFLQWFLQGTFIQVGNDNKSTQRHSTVALCNLNPRLLRLAAMYAMQRGVKPGTAQGTTHQKTHHDSQRTYGAIRQRGPLQRVQRGHHDGWCRSPLHTSPLIMHTLSEKPIPSPRDLVQTDAVTADAGAAASGSGGIGAVMFSVLSAAMGAFSFGYALSVVNGPLDAIALDLGFAGDAALQGMVRSGFGEIKHK